MAEYTRLSEMAAMFGPFNTFLADQVAALAEAEKETQRRKAIGVPDEWRGTSDDWLRIGAGIVDGWAKGISASGALRFFEREARKPHGARAAHRKALKKRAR